MKLETIAAEIDKLVSNHLTTHDIKSPIDTWQVEKKCSLS